MCIAQDLGAEAVRDEVREVAQVHEADDVVDALAEDRESRTTGLDGEVQRLAHRRGVGDVDHVDARHHHLAHDGVTELDDRMDEVTLLGLDRLVLVRDVGHGEDLGLGHARRSPSRSEPADDGVGDGEQEVRDPLDRPELQYPTHDRRGRQRGRVRVLHRVVLRDRLEDDEDYEHLARRWR
jgi:hypothetical protein